MNFLFPITATIALLLAPLTCYLFLSMERYRKRAKQLEVMLAGLNAQLESLKKEAEEIKELRHQYITSSEQKSIAIAEKQEADKKLMSMKQERDDFLKQKEIALHAQYEAEKKLQLMEQKISESEKRMQDWERQRSESLQAAKASILEAGSQLSSKLLEDHKRETESAKKETEEKVKQTSEALLEKMLVVSNSVASLKENNAKMEKTAQTIWRALASPSGAGSLAEVSLENMLKNFDLEPNRDYVMQYSMNTGENSRLRPDAVLFLPQNRVMVIDSKSSKFLIEIADAATTESESELLQKLNKTMNTHLKDLSGKSYADAIRTQYKEWGKSEQITHIMNVMFLPNENAVTHIKKADPEFIQKAERMGILLASPTSLSGLLSLAKFNMGIMQQAENHERIVSKVQELMDNVITVLEYSEKVGKGLKSASNNFDSFINSINSRMLPKMRQLGNLGIKPSRNKEVPAQIANLSGNMITIEAEVAELEGIE